MINLASMIVNIRHEIQETSPSIWTDAELTRAIQKSVNLMSRLIPRRVFLETTIIIDVDDESFTTPTTASATAIVNGQTLNGVSDGGTLTIADNTPDVPRRLTVKLTDANASVTTLVIIVKGYNQGGEYIEESWFLKDLPSGTAVQGKKYFKYVSEVEVDDIGGTAAAADTIDVGTGNAYDSYISLANKAIKYDSETVTSDPAGTTYVRDTGYRMDYLEGRIKFINGSTMAAGTAYLISYDLDPTTLDITNLLPKEDYIRIEKVEYPVGDDPPTYIPFETYGDVLVLRKKSLALTEDDHLRLMYLKPWTAPAANAPGDYPAHLDDVVIIGSVGQALIYKAEKYTQQSITEIALANAAADSMATPLADINVALDKVTTHVTEADTALDKVATYLETSDTTDNAKDVLANITDNIADLRTAMETALDKSSTYLTSVDTPPSAHDYLVDGDDKITTFNMAERVPENYADYARAAIQIYNGLIAEATIRLENLKSYIEEASGWMRMGDTFIAEAGQRLGMAGAFVAEAVQRVNEVNAWAVQADRYIRTSEIYLNIAGRYLASGQAKINEFLVSLGVKPEMVSYKSSSEQFS